MSPEQIGQADGDLVFAASYGDEGRTAGGQLTTGGLVLDDLERFAQQLEG